MDDDLETTEEAFAAIPPEVQHYIYSDAFSYSLDELCSSFIVSDELKNSFKGALFSFIAQINDEEDLLIAINEISSDETVRQNIKDWINENVNQKILTLIADGYANEEDDIDSNTTASLSREPIVTPLASLADRLKKASIAAPAKRDSEGAAVSSVPSAIDPYHESIDNGK
jgi:hypothetical protein